MVEEARKVTKKTGIGPGGWQWLIRLHQWNLPRMVVPSVLTLYTEALTTLHYTHPAKSIGTNYNLATSVQHGP